VHKNMEAGRSGQEVHQSFGQLMQNCLAQIRISELRRSDLEGMEGSRRSKISKQDRKELKIYLGRTDLRVNR
jgi:hypothetical protein